MEWTEEPRADVVVDLELWKNLFLNGWALWAITVIDRFYTHNSIQTIPPPVLHNFLSLKRGRVVLTEIRPVSYLRQMWTQWRR